MYAYGGKRCVQEAELANISDSVASPPCKGSALPRHTQSHSSPLACPYPPRGEVKGSYRAHPQPREAPPTVPTHHPPLGRWVLKVNRHTHIPSDQITSFDGLIGSMHAFTIIMRCAYTDPFASTK